MWYRNENGGYNRPDEVDTTSSHNYVYVRRNIVFVEERQEGDEVFPAHYEWEEMKVPRSMWPVYIEQMQNAANIEYIAMMTDVELEPEE